MEVVNLVDDNDSDSDDEMIIWINDSKILSNLTCKNEIIDLISDDEDDDNKSVVIHSYQEESDGEEVVLAQGININGEWKGDDLRKFSSYNKPTFNGNTY
jgi:hypothetical protein